ncbi:MAG: phosphoglucosamine mutase [Hyphomonadaceae bacterium]|nr:phosphoglucosamine mutase [Clostridia bacterium]
MGKLFGTDGVRGIANVELTAEMAFKIGQAGALVLTKETLHKPKILVGKDTRISGDLLESALVAGICSVGAQAVLLGVVPTPAVAYLTRAYNADAGVVISASHNPMAYNGIKFFNKDGYKLRDDIEASIEAIILGQTGGTSLPSGKDIGRVTRLDNALDDYIAFAKKTIEGDLKGIKIAIDCANGAAYEAAPVALFELDAEVSVIYDEPNGLNINEHCGSTHMNDLCKFVLETGADIGLAFDGDADRVLAVDEKGQLVDGDKILAICATYLNEQGKLPKNAFVATVMSNLGLFIMGREKGIDIPQTKVGDRYVLEKMVHEGYVLGGEQSGHVIFLDYNTTGDGLVTALQLLTVMKNTGKKLSELASVMQVMPQVLVNAKVSNEKKYLYMEDLDVAQSILELQHIFSDEGRVLIRPSGTEPLVRVMIEGKDIALITEKAEALAKLIELKFSE